MNKIAIIITGHIRKNHIENLSSVVSILQTLYKTNIDIYASIWNKTEDNIIISNDHPFGQDITTKLLDLDNYNAIKPIFELDYDRTHHINYILSLSKQEIFARFMDESKKEERGTHCGFGPEAIEYWVNRLKDQYYPIYQGYKLVPNPEQYDLIFRLRTDFRLLLKPVIKFGDRPFIIRNNISKAVFISGYDCFQYGNPKVMEKYFNLYKHIDLYVNDYCRLNKHFYNTFNSENLIRHHMIKFGDNPCYIYEEDLVEGRDFLLGR